MKKHVPVLFAEVIKYFEEINSNKLIAIDCTLGQGGHSKEIFELMKEGVLLSIDLNKNSIEWVANEYNLTIENNKYQKPGFNKKWILNENNFVDFDLILRENNLQKADFILADLGFSNYELKQNIGISYSESKQDLNMNYSNTNNSITAKDILNKYTRNQLKNIFQNYFDQKSLKVVLNRLIDYRESKEFRITGDLQYALKKLPNNFLIKVTQALRAYINAEEEGLANLCKKIKLFLSDGGIGLVITFNNLEEKIVNSVFGDHQIVEPNINEIIKNPQSRSAKLHIYKNKSITTKEAE